jgi:hypothetical protein
MVRDSLEPGAKHFSVLMTGKKDVGILWRKDTHRSTHIQGYGNAAHDFIWLKLTKRMNIFTGYKSFDGQEWTAVGRPQTVEMDVGDLKVGLALTSHHSWKQTEAIFENFENSNYFFPSAAPSASPAPTLTVVSSDIGKYNAALPSEVDVQGSNKYIVKASGADIWGREDGFTFINRQVAGDFDMTVHVTSIETAHSWTKFGLMARDSLDSKAKSIFAVFAPNKGTMMQIRREYRQSTRANSRRGHRPKSIWLRLTREGNVFAGYYSLVGGILQDCEWNRIREYTLAFDNSELEIGIAVTSHHWNRYAIAEFDLFNIELPNGVNATDTGRRGLRGSA